MKVIKKINNNVAIGLDGNQREVIIFGKGVGFPQMPYELTDLSKITRTFYDIDSRYYGLLQEIPEEVFLLVSALVERAKTKLKGSLNPNLAFVLADHVNFAVERNRKGMNVGLPYSYELEYQYPELTRISRWFIKNVNEKLHVELDRSEVTSITMHFLNALEGEKDTGTHMEEGERINRVISIVTRIVEDYFDVQVDRSSFHYFRFKNHIKFFVQRKEKGGEFSQENEELYESIRTAYPGVADCVARIDDYLEEEFGERCPKEELLYLMIHVKQLYSKESRDS